MDRGAWQATVLESDLTERTEHKHNTKTMRCCKWSTDWEVYSSKCFHQKKKKKTPQVDNLTLDLKELGK